MMLAVLEYGIEDEEMAELTKRLASYLSKEKATMSGNSFGPENTVLRQHIHRRYFNAKA
jgi:hypothetical protein